MNGTNLAVRKTRGGPNRVSTKPGAVQIPTRNLHTQLGEWAKLGFITRTGFAIYALNTPPADTPSTAAPDP